MLGKLPLAVAAAVLAGSGHNAAVAQEGAETGASETLYSISGQVVDARDGVYVIRSDGGGRSSIRLAGWPSDPPARGPGIGIGDEVTAIGRLDQDVLDGGALDVLGVYVEDRRAYFTLGRATEGSPGALTPLIMPNGELTPAESPASLIGVIAGIDEGRLVFRTGDANVVVETATLGHDPYDDIGSEPLRVGDLVIVEGALGRGREGEPRFLAESVTSIFVLAAAA